MLARLTLALTIATCAKAQPDPRQLFLRATELQRAGDYEGAIRQYREAVAADPSSVPLRSNLGAALAHLGRYSEAIVEYKAALQTAPAAMTPQLRLNLGLALYKSGQLTDAAREFDEVHHLQPGEINPALLAADCYLRLGDLDQVISLLTPLATKHADDRALTYLLGMALIRSGQSQKGQVLVDRLLRDGSAEAHFLLGSVAFMAQDYPVASKEFRQAIALNPQLPSLYSYFGRALLFAGDPDGAADAFQKQLTVDANDYDANLQLGEILRFRRDYNQARPLYKNALVLRPASPEAGHGLAVLELADGHPEEALRRLEQIIAQWPKYRDARESLAAAYEKLGRVKDAADARALASNVDARSDAPAGLALGSDAPDFELMRPSSGPPVRLSAFRGKQPVVLIFGSYTCPKFRSQVAALNALFGRFHNRALFLLVYIREAHPDSSWQSTANEREGIEQTDAATLDQKRSYAAACLRKLAVKYDAVVDGIDDAVDKTFQAWPSRVYLIGAGGKVLFNSVLDQLQFDPAALENALRTELTSPGR
jgi:tetratricopeptide (TPR) repeat protein